MSDGPSPGGLTASTRATATGRGAIGARAPGAVTFGPVSKVLNTGRTT